MPPINDKKKKKKKKKKTDSFPPKLIQHSSNFDLLDERHLKFQNVAKSHLQVYDDDVYMRVIAYLSSTSLTLTYTIELYRVCYKPLLDIKLICAASVICHIKLI